MIAHCVLFLCSVTQAKTVYSISRHSDSTIQAYLIDGDQLKITDPDTYTGSLPDHGSGAIDLAIDDISRVLFASYDGANVIEAISAKTMDKLALESMSGSTENEIAGLDYCYTYNYLLAAERYDSNIRAIKYDSFNRVFTDNIEIALPNVTGGILGVCIDEIEMRLYISQSDTVVKYYDFVIQDNEPNVTYGGEIPIEWNEENKIAVGIAFYNDGSGTKYLYSSGYNHEDPSEHPYIIRTSLTSDNAVVDQLGVHQPFPSTYVAGIDVDSSTGYLYATTLGYKSSIQVYDPNRWTIDPNDCQYTHLVENENIQGPAGIVVSSKDFLPSQLWFQKEQVDPNSAICSEPNMLVSYKACFHQGWKDEHNVILREFLPEESAFVSADPNTGYYDSFTHTYFWDIGDLEGWDPNEQSDPNQYFEITIRILDTAEPGGSIINFAEVESDSAYSSAQIETSICCWTANDLIFVDKKATGHASGVDWENAYVTLNDALARANGGCGSEIWVTQGVYCPGNDIPDNYEVPDNVKIFGGFNGTETQRNQRNWTLNETVLCGFIDNDSNGDDIRNEVIVTMGNDSHLDGFTVETAELHGITGASVDISVENCVIRDCDQRGVYLLNGDLTMKWCQVWDNRYQGIYHSGDGYVLNIINSRIYNNQKDGIYANSSTCKIENSLIYQNGFGGAPSESYYGAALMNTTSDSILRNNTIVSNIDEGVYFSGSNLPNILNCILWNNAGKQTAGFDADTAAFYSCIQDCNDVNFNISFDPNFAYGDLADGNTNMHLAYNSPCKDAGFNDAIDPNNFDIDGEPRIYGNCIDIGADEVYTCDGDLTENDIYSPLDFDADGLLNYSEFAAFSEVWLIHDPNDPAVTTDPNHASDPNYLYVDDEAIIVQWQQAWDSRYNLDTTSTSQYDIDLADLEIFWNDYWFWVACWKQNEFFEF